jgi:hypothetical protein
MYNTNFAPNVVTEVLNDLEAQPQDELELSSIEVDFSDIADDMGNPIVSNYSKSLSDDTIGAFFKEMSRYPLLKPEEEVELANNVQLLVKAEEKRLELTEKLKFIHNEYLGPHVGNILPQHGSLIDFSLSYTKPSKTDEENSK